MVHDYKKQLAKYLFLTLGLYFASTPICASNLQQDTLTEQNEQDQNGDYDENNNDAIATDLINKPDDDPIIDTPGSACKDESTTTSTKESNCGCSKKDITKSCCSEKSNTDTIDPVAKKIGRAHV